MKYLLIIVLVIFLFIVFPRAWFENKTCSDFNSQKEAQEYFNKNIIKHHNLDRDNDWIACESLK